MIVVSIDIETTGLNPETCQVLEFAAVLYDTGKPLGDQKLPSFHTRLAHLTVEGDPFALSMHPKLLRAIANGEGCTNHLAEDFNEWLTEVYPGCIDQEGRAKITCAGKNFSAFDFQFLKRVEGWQNYIRVKHRALDPAGLYFDPVRDTDLPSMDECCLRAGLTTGKHDALGDARLVVQLLGHHYAIQGAV